MIGASREWLLKKGKVSEKSFFFFFIVIIENVWCSQIVTLNGFNETDHCLYVRICFVN